ncbi:MAG: hypothetical protein A2V77_21270 [Anaeromyxobacter sp. RBG_16_69_14]|nr:MAG: hypothetical protein A2V77_21270 [Anaeromyxobacter sp. RBG_16_69_14]
MGWPERGTRELPAALEPARRLAHEERIDDVVEHAPGDLRRDELGSGTDVILLANILHHVSPDEILDLLRLGPLEWDLRGLEEGGRHRHVPREFRDQTAERLLGAALEQPFPDRWPSGAGPSSGPSPRVHSRCPDPETCA